MAERSVASEALHWDAAVGRRLTQLLGAASPAMLAAFDADGTLWDIDVGETFLRHVSEAGHLPKWPEPGAAWKEYVRRLETGDLRYAFDFCVTAFEGMHETDVVARALEFYEGTWESYIFAPMRELIASLQRAEADVYVVSGSAWWCVVPGAARLGVAAENVIAAHPGVDGEGRITGRLKRPLPTLETKVEALLEIAGRPPHFAAGNSTYDYPMLESARNLALMINPPADESWRSRRNGNGWLVQRWPTRPTLR